MRTKKKPPGLLKSPGGQHGKVSSAMTTIATTTNLQRLTDELAAADHAYTLAVQDAVGNHGDWAHVRQAGEVVRQARSALKAAS